MPKTVVYKHDPPAPKQVKFPARRHNTRSGAGAARSLPQKLKRQSTLTQLDFVSTPHSSHEVIPNSSDEDEEYTERKPKRRRKLDPKARDQSTLTQNWRRRAMEQGSSDGEFADWEEDTTTMDVTESEGGKAQDTQGTARYLFGRMQEVSSEMQELGDGHSDVSPAIRQHRMLVASSDAGDGSTRPSTADSKATLQTPKKARRTEVPSSQTPSSAILSVHKTWKNREYDASPLKGHSNSPMPLKKSPRSQTSSPSKRMLRHMESNISYCDATPSGDAKSELWKAELVSSPRRKYNSAPATGTAAAPIARRLARSTTVQDSQDEVDLAPMERSLKRITTVQDSQSESDLEVCGSNNDQDDETELTVMLEVSDKERPEMHTTVDEPQIDTTQPRGSSLQDYEHDDKMEIDAEEGLAHEYKYTASLQQQTYDPVSAALDRDAARFGRGATQLVIQPQSDAYCVGSSGDKSAGNHNDGEEGGDFDDVSMHGSEERAEDSEPECVAESPVEADPETQFVADSPSAEMQYQPSPELGEFTQASENLMDGNGEHDSVHHGQPQSMAIVPDMEGPELAMPPSPKVPRPSQVSTVVSTQGTTSRPNSGHGNAPTSPRKSAAWTNTLSSSPFPLPPESWRGAQSYRDLETQSSDIFDFSLPPPPPLLSSAKQTPASSSR